MLKPLSIQGWFTHAWKYTGLIHYSVVFKTRLMHAAEIVIQTESNAITKYNFMGYIYKHDVFARLCLILSMFIYSTLH